MRGAAFVATPSCSIEWHYPVFSVPEGQSDCRGGGATADAALRVSDGSAPGYMYRCPALEWRCIVTSYIAMLLS